MLEYKRCWYPGFLGRMMNSCGGRMFTDVTAGKYLVQCFFTTCLATVGAKTRGELVFI